MISLSPKFRHLPKSIDKTWVWPANPNIYKYSYFYRNIFYIIYTIYNKLKIFVLTTIKIMILNNNSYSFSNVYNTLWYYINILCYYYCHGTEMQFVKVEIYEFLIHQNLKDILYIFLLNMLNNDGSVIRLLSLCSKPTLKF